MDTHHILTNCLTDAAAQEYAAQWYDNERKGTITAANSRPFTAREAQKAMVKMRIRSYGCDVRMHLICSSN